MENQSNFQYLIKEIKELKELLKDFINLTRLKVEMRALCSL